MATKTKSKAKVQVPRNIASPTNDIAFKKLFADPKNSDLLIDFLNAVLSERIGLKITSVQPKSPVQIPEYKSLKTTILDVYCQDSEKNNFIVEMQVAPTGWSFERAQYYVGKTFTAQVEKGKKYTDAKPVYFIAILSFVMFEQHDRYITFHQMLDADDHVRYLTAYNCVFIELPKFKNPDLKRLIKPLEAWCMFIKDSQKKDLMDQLMEKSETIGQAINVLNTFSWDEKERMAYEDFEKTMFDNHLAKQYVKEMGLKEGEEIGLKKGLEKGKEEAKVEMAKKLLAINLPLQTIVEATGLSLKEIEKLKP